MALVIERCRTCGFDLPSDTGECPGCAGRAAAGPPLAARQAAGLALPTRSVHPLPSTPPRQRAPRPIGRARAARSAFSFTTALALFTFAAAGAAWLSTQPRLVLDVPAGTADLLDDLTTTLATASVVALVLGIAALVEWCARAVLVALVSRRRRRS